MNTSATPESALNYLLANHTQLVLFVLPDQCTGLGEFPPGEPLRLHVGYGLLPPMAVEVRADGLAFAASFRGVPRSVWVPWVALLFAGSEDMLAQLRARLRAQAERATAAPAPDGGTDNVVRVDFAAKKRAAQGSP